MPCARSPTGPPPCQTPEKSGRPSASLGAGPCGAAGPRPRPVLRPPAPAGDVEALGGLAPVGSCPPCRCCATSAGTIAIAAIVVAKMNFFITSLLCRGWWRAFAFGSAGRSGKHALAARERDVARVGHFRSVLRHRSHDGDFVANLQRRSCPPLSHENVRARELEIPRRDGPIGFLDVDVKARV